MEPRVEFLTANQLKVMVARKSHYSPEALKELLRRKESNEDEQLTVWAETAVELTEN